MGLASPDRIETTPIERVAEAKSAFVFFPWTLAFDTGIETTRPLASRTHTQTDRLTEVSKCFTRMVNDLHDDIDKDYESTKQ